MDEREGKKMITLQEKELLEAQTPSLNSFFQSLGKVQEGGVIQIMKSRVHDEDLFFKVRRVRDLYDHMFKVPWRELLGESRLGQMRLRFREKKPHQIQLITQAFFWRDVKRPDSEDLRDFLSQREDQFHWNGQSFDLIQLEVLSYPLGGEKEERVLKAWTFCGGWEKRFLRLELIEGEVIVSEVSFLERERIKLF